MPTIVAVAVGSIAGLVLSAWAATTNAPRWLVSVDDALVRLTVGAYRLIEPAPTLDDSLVGLSARELKMGKLPVGYRYHSLPYPAAARWDETEVGRCQLHAWASNIPNPKADVHLTTDATVDGMYGLFLSNVDPPGAGNNASRQLLEAYLAQEKTLRAVEERIRREAGRGKAREWRAARSEMERSYLALGKQLQGAISAAAGSYAKAIIDYANDGYRDDYRCGDDDVRLRAYNVRESLAELREPAATRTTIASLAELVEGPAGARLEQSESAASLGSAEISLSYRRVRILHITRGGWFNEDAVRTLASNLRRDSPRFWGDEGIFPLIPMALLVVTEPVLKVKLSPTQAREVRELLERQGALKVGAFEFDFSKAGAYVASSSDGTLRTEIEFVAPRNEVVVLGIISKRPDIL